MTKSIPLTKGKFALVDDEDFEWLNKWKWHCNSNGYAVRFSKTIIRKAMLMHREIKNPPIGMFVDHIDGNKLNNVRKNLRYCNYQQNSANSKTPVNSSSGYKGVSRDSRRNESWKASITVDGKQIYICTCKTPEEAARAYDEAARKYFGEFARTNFGD